MNFLHFLLDLLRFYLGLFLLTSVLLAVLAAVGLVGVGIWRAVG